jgi:hypothetical protein
MIASSSAASRLKRSPRAGSSFPTTPRKSRTGTRSETGTITPLDVKAGDKILFGKWSGTEVKVDGEELIIMKESDILGIIG